MLKEMVYTAVMMTLVVVAGLLFIISAVNIYRANNSKPEERGKLVGSAIMWGILSVLALAVLLGFFALIVVVDPHAACSNSLVHFAMELVKEFTGAQTPLCGPLTPAQ